ncbi:MAG: Rrf2 family transcriptional regulator [Isosphaeraceae bacterium]
MRISAKAEYACLALIELARTGREDPRRVREIAGCHGISGRYLVQILLQLKAAGLVESARGSQGGYQLARPAARSRWPRSSRRSTARAIPR